MTSVPSNSVDAYASQSMPHAQAPELYLQSFRDQGMAGYPMAQNDPYAQSYTAFPEYGRYQSDINGEFGPSGGLSLSRSTSQGIPNQLPFPPNQLGNQQPRPSNQIPNQHRPSNNPPMQRTVSAPPRQPVSVEHTTTPTHTPFHRFGGWTMPQLDETPTIIGSLPIVNNPQSSTSTLPALPNHRNTSTSTSQPTTKTPPEVAKEPTAEPVVTTPPNRCEWENCHIQFSTPEELIAHVKGPASLSFPEISDDRPLDNPPRAISLSLVNLHRRRTYRRSSIITHKIPHW
jgi:hypothetical protein